MKKRIITLQLVAFLLTCLTSNAQFQRAYQPDYLQAAGNSIQTISFLGKGYENYYVGGYMHDNHQAKFTPMLASFDLEGDFLWGVHFEMPDSRINKIQKANGYQQSNWPYHSIDFTLAGLVAVGQIEIPDQKTDALFIRTDHNGHPQHMGKEITYKTYGGPGSELVTDVVDFKNGFIMVGKSSSYIDKGSGGYLLKVDGWGELIKSKVVYSLQHRLFLNSIEKTRDGNFLVCGTLYSDLHSTQTQQHDIHIMKIDGDLNVLWSRSITEINNPKYSTMNSQSAVSIREDKQGNILVAANGSFLTTNQNTQDQVILLKLNHAGDPIWGKTYRIGGDEIIDDFQLSYEKGGTKYLLSGSIANYRYTGLDGYNSDAFLLKTDEHGAIDWAYSYYIPSSKIAWLEIGKRLTVFEGKYAFTGQYGHYGGERIYLTEVPDNGFNGDGNCYSDPLHFDEDYYRMTVEDLHLEETLAYDYEEHEITYSKLEIDSESGCKESNTSARELEKSDIENLAKSGSFLSQNYPNPVTNECVIFYELPAGARSAAIQVIDLQGKVIQSYTDLMGKGEIKVNKGDLQRGLYQYSLIVDGELLESKKMIIGN